MWYYLLAGLAGGVIGGMGMGGGTLLIPILTILLDVPQLTAQAINLISFIPMALISLIIHIKNKLVDYKQLLIITPLAMVACGIGAYFSSKISQEILKISFGYLMIIIGVSFIIKFIVDCIKTKLKRNENIQENNQKSTK